MRALEALEGECSVLTAAHEFLDGCAVDGGLPGEPLADAEPGVDGRRLVNPEPLAPLGGYLGDQVEPDKPLEQGGSL